MRHMINPIIIVSLSLLICACVPTIYGANQTTDKRDATSTKPPGREARVGARLINADTVEVGRADITQGKDGVQLDITVSNLAPGSYGVHLHMVGKCDAPDFKSAGGHWNPEAKQHGRDNPMGSHLGDLPNLLVTKQNKGKMSIALPGVLVAGNTGLLDADGTSIIIHSMPDDYKTDPSGNSGARAICGVFGLGS